MRLAVTCLSALAAACVSGASASDDSPDASPTTAVTREGAALFAATHPASRQAGVVAYRLSRLIDGLQIEPLDESGARMAIYALRNDRTGITLTPSRPSPRDAHLLAAASREFDRYTTAPTPARTRAFWGPLPLAIRAAAACTHSTTASPACADAMASFLGR